MSLRDIESEIEATRNELDRTLEALQDRLSPSRRLRAAWSAARGGRAGTAAQGGAAAVRQAGQWVMANPVPVIAVGVALLFGFTFNAGEGGRRRR